MKGRRKERVESLLKRELSNIITFEIDKPEGVNFITVSRIDLSKDGRKATVYISTLRREEAIKSVETLNKAAGYIHGLLGRRLRMKIVPRPEFKVALDSFTGE
ncbi:30S ribosome-binding factor RbfA [Desulfurobacterium atlanticum]|uniref:Ribosome-binding factor A n=1 Tax=Desulfurobacterium atlanticum TaxID=240169 RepID=A0A238ZMM0_9BACT|nr:30S ribosome-binding factor RbfA [Desulfurobacterium atlanticum]SNR84379.1 ribosome-binding factor A [Desulfurobacterium atlanticum]